MLRTMAALVAAMVEATAAVVGVEGDMVVMEGVDGAAVVEEVVAEGAVGVVVVVAVGKCVLAI
jgi:hypothetical protein